MITRRSEFYVLPHTTGPGSVLVSLKFGKKLGSDPEIVYLHAVGEPCRDVRFDLDRHIREIQAGVDRANKEFGGTLEVTAVEVVPDDYPQEGQAQTAAYRIASAVLKNEI